jgi:DNA sulfur modification protein DndD
LKQQDNLEQEIERISKRQTEIKQESEYQETFKKETSNLLRELSAAKELQERRQELEKQKASSQENLRESKEAIKKAISARGYTVLLCETTAQFRTIVNDLKQQGKLTSGISREFVNELLDSQRCICGADLREGNHSHKNVRKILDKAGSSAVQETAIRMSAQVDEIDKQAVSFWEEVDREQARINQLRQTISQIEGELDNIQERLRKDANEEISSLQKRLDEIEEKIRDLILEQGANQQQIATLKTELEVLRKQIAKQKLNEDRQALAQRRIAQLKMQLNVSRKLETVKKSSFVGNSKSESKRYSAKFHYTLHSQN